MAEPKPTDDNNKKLDSSSSLEDKLNKSPQNVANLHLPQVIAALHQNAIAKCKGDLGDKFQITNSALDENGGKVTLTSSGQHIISVIPTEAAAKDKAKVIKKNAIKILQTYVSWFVGPDLAKDVNDSTVKPLTEAPGNESKKKNESTIPFMKFSQFLHEAKDDEADSQPEFGDDEDEGSAIENKPGDDQFNDEPEDENKDEKDKDAEEDGDDETIESKLGYYVPYDLKVEGLKQTALKDSMKKFAMNFFDDLKITASGLFGGGDSFTIKDVKDKWRSAFGPIDPDDLVKNVEDRIRKKYKGSDSSFEVKVQDKATLINDLGSYINGKQKQKIDSADYSLFILVGRDDPKKEIFNPGIIADIVQSSITGLYKKFKNKITKNDIIYVPEYHDEHRNTDKLRKIYSIVPNPDQIKTAINKSRDAADAWQKIDKLFDALKKMGSEYQNCNRAQKCYGLWLKYNEEWNKRKDNTKTRESLTGTSKEDYFKKFIDQYIEEYKNSEDKKLNESYKPASFVISNAAISKLLFENMFGRSLMHLYEDKSEDNNEQKNSIDAKKIVDDAIYYLNDSSDKIFSKKYAFKNNVKCISVLQLKNVYRYFNIDDSIVKKETNNNQLKNALCITPSSNVDDLMSESSIRNAIMDILFEADAVKAKVDVKSLNDLLARVIHDNTDPKSIVKFAQFKPKTINDVGNETSNDKDSNEKPNNNEGKDDEDDKANEEIFNSLNESVNQEDIIKAIQNRIDSGDWKLDDVKKSFESYVKEWNNIDPNLKKTNKAEYDKLINKLRDNDKYYHQLKKDLVELTDDSEGVSKLAHSRVLDMMPKIIDSFKDNSNENNKKESKPNDQNKDKKSNEQSNSNSKNDENKTIEGIDDLYVAFFGEEAIAGDIDVKMDARNEQNDRNESNDLYIVPMPGLKYEDPEYANTNI